uniref:G-protein coupled receptors family 1 profile domain-containing protein n=1 Tax=Mola mola TaxID=94237 RepID=A0A3Q3XMY3_MOLML
MSQVLTVDAILFGLLVFSGILGNISVIHVVFQSAFDNPSQRIPPSDAILVHLSPANLLSSLFPTVPIFVSDPGLDVSLSPGWCRGFMLPWVWWRAVGFWLTLALSFFHSTTVRRQHTAGLDCFGAGVGGVNLAFLIPVLIYTTHVNGNTTASTSLALNEALPQVLMVCTNLATLHALTKHIPALDKHVSTEQKAAHVIMSLVSLFVVCWTLQVAVVTCYNHDGGHHAEGLLNVAHFSASLSVGFSPMVVALGHGQLRQRIMKLVHYPICHCLFVLC